MKKLILSTLSIALLAGGIASCGKSSTGKMSNEWSIDSFEEKEVNTASNGSTTTTTTKISGKTITRTETAPSGQTTTTTTETGTVSKSDYTINKDGTWNRELEYTFTSSPATGITVVTKTTDTQSGTWAFVGKSKGEDFKKNERVLFNTLSSTSTGSSTTTIGSNSNVTNSASSATFLTGENTAIYTVTESKKKELTLASDGKQTYTSGNNTSSDAVTTTISLVQK